MRFAGGSRISWWSWHTPTPRPCTNEPDSIVNDRVTQPRCGGLRQRVRRAPTGCRAASRHQHAGDVLPGGRGAQQHAQRLRYDDEQAAPHERWMQSALVERIVDCTDDNARIENADEREQTARM